MLNDIKYLLWVAKEWLKRLYIYPQRRILPGAHFDYDAYWREKRGQYMGRLGRWQLKRARLASSIIYEGNDTTINDLGSGAGEVLNDILKSLPGAKGIAYDSSAYALEIAKSSGLETRMMDINKAGDFEKIEQADYTLMFEILEHIPESEELLKEAFNKSRRGVMFSFPNTGFFIHRCRLFFFGKFPLQWTKHPGEHLRFWTKKDLVWWLEAQGYRNYKIYHYAGTPLLKSVWPNMFAAGMFVYIKK